MGGFKLATLVAKLHELIRLTIAGLRICIRQRNKNMTRKILHYYFNVTKSRIDVGHVYIYIYTW